MSNDSRQTTANAVNGEAINRVLQAEYAAQQAVEECEGEAKVILQQAGLQAQRIHQRAEERFARVEMRCAQWLSEQERKLAREDSQVADETEDIPELDISEIVEVLAAQLSGGGGEAA